MSKPYAWTILGTLTVLAAAPAFSDSARNAAERANDNAEIRQDHRQRFDDRNDLLRLESLAERFDAARGRGDIDELRRLEQQLRGVMAGERRESRGELAGDRAEVRRDNRELWTSRREVRRDGPSDASAAERLDDRRDLRDDRRDRRDDHRDAAVERQALERRAQIAKELRELFGNFDNPALDRKRTLLGELIVIERAETAQNGRELREDRRERREDRRERREDRPSGS